MKNHLETQLLAILGEHPWFMAALDAVSDLGLPQWCIGAGVIRNIVFDQIDGGSTTPIRDVDVAYFDPSDGVKITVLREDRAWSALHYKAMSNGRPHLIRQRD
jgi:hypothetical protein